MPEQASPLPEVWETTKAICQRFKICRTTLWAVSKEAGFPSPIRFGRGLRWDSEATKVFLQQRGKR